MKKVLSRVPKEKLEEIRLDKSSLIKLPGGTEIKVWFYQDEGGKTQTYMLATVAKQKPNFFVQLDVDSVHICWDRKALESKRIGFVAKNIVKEKNDALGVVYDFKSKEIFQICAVPLPKNFEKT